MLSKYLLNSHLENENNFSYKPSFFRINAKTDKILLQDLLKKNPHIQIFDQITGQLKELIKLLHPTQKLAPADYQPLIEKHLNGCDITEYGVWVYYPWSNRLVHILDEDEFIEVRTNRNYYKITPKEKEILASKKVGVVGLSVGQSVAVTMAMERICREIRLADFDELELTNLNRIRTGLHNLGLNKTYSVAREISEIDPFIQIKCFPDGLTEQNIDAFFLEGGKLDVFIDECDGLDMKIISRYKAKALQIPVLMEASDRCMVDVERFDLHPELPILHGMINHLDIEKLKTLKTNEEKIPYLLDIIGIDTCSTRLKASMIEIEQTITTWPQLASAVTLGGGVMTDVARRLLLNQFDDSGRYFVDIEDIIGNKTATTELSKVKAVEYIEPLSILQMCAMIDSSIDKSNSPEKLDDSIVKEIIQASSKAPSGGNCQPWKWIYRNNDFHLFHDKNRSESLLDFAHHASFIALGASVENFILKAHEYNLEVAINWLPLNDQSNYIAKIKIVKQEDSKNHPALAFEDHKTDSLAEFISARATNRKTFQQKTSIPKNILDEIKSTAEVIPGAQVRFIEDENTIARLGNIISEIEKIRIMTKRGHGDFVKEIRWNEREATETLDGIDIRTIDLTPSEIAGFTVAKNWEIIEKLNDWKVGNAFKKLSQKGVASCSVLGLILMPQSNPIDFLLGGRAVQKAWLASTKLNIAFQPMSPSTFLFSRLLHGDIKDFPLETVEKLQNLRKEFTSILSLDSNIGEIFLFRLFESTEPEIKSFRLSLEQILHIE